MDSPPRKTKRLHGACVFKQEWISDARFSSWINESNDKCQAKSFKNVDVEKVAPTYEHFVEISKAVSVEDDIDNDALMRSSKNLGSNKKPSFYIQQSYVYVEDISKGRSKP
ncbi:hypothetical protein ACJJTC_013498 [Scirpophaga incertulas]